MYKRKTEDEFEILGNYGFGFELVTTEVTRQLAKEQLKEYRKNEPGIPFTFKKRRVPIESSCQ